jgi:uncharacterized protein
MARITGKYVSVTSFKRDGTPVSTPMWFVAENGHLLLETGADSGKVKRIRANDRVLVAPCSASGKIKGEQVAGHVELLPDDELARVEELMARKYRVDKVLVLPVYRAVQRLRGKHAVEGKPVALEITTE